MWYANDMSIKMVLKNKTKEPLCAFLQPQNCFKEGNAQDSYWEFWGTDNLL